MKAINQKNKTQNFGLAAASIAVLSFMIASPAMAQVGNATSIADPAKAGDQIRQNDLTPQVSPDVSVGEVRQQGAPAGAENIKFELQGISFDGVTAYNDADLKSVYSGDVGQTITLADLYTIANRVAAKYRNDGYLLAQVVVPPQEISGGTAKLRVIEGYVQNINITKSDESAKIDMDNIKSYAEQISHGGPLNVRDLERQLLIINDLPGVTARTVLSPSATTAGAADMDIIVNYDPIDALVSVDNYGSRYLGDVQVGASATLNSLFGQNEAISTQLVVAPDGWRELTYGSLGYEQPIGRYGTKLHFLGNVTDTDPGFDLEQFAVKGRSYLLNAGVTHPIIRSRAQNLNARLNYDWRRVRSSNNIEDTRRDRLSVVRAGLRYEFIDNLITAGANTFDLEASKGLSLFGASEKSDLNKTRVDGNPQFAKLELEIQRLQRITSSVNLMLAGRGQLSNGPLLSSEEFSVGGISSGRGYDPSEISGDDGISGKVELQWKDPVDLQTRFVEGYQVFGFYDVGRVWNDDATSAAQDIESLASVGGGFRFDLPNEVDAGFALAVPLTRQPQTDDGHDTKVYFNVSKRF